MVEVPMSGCARLAEDIAALGNRIQGGFQFRACRAGETPLLHLVAHERAVLFTATRSGVMVTAWQAEAVTRYLGVPPAAYLLVASLLGLVQWRALSQNSPLEPEDFAHETPHHCLFARQLMLEEYAIRFENPQVCPSCFAFYGFLIPQAELAALRDALEFVRHGRAVCA